MIFSFLVTVLLIAISIIVDANDGYILNMSTKQREEIEKKELEEKAEIEREREEMERERQEIETNQSDKR